MMGIRAPIRYGYFQRYDIFFLQKMHLTFSPAKCMFQYLFTDL